MVSLELCCLLSSVRSVRQCDAEILSLPFDQSNYKVCRVLSLDAKFYIDADIGKNDRIKRELMKKGVLWESHIGKLIRKYTKRGSVAVDTGSRIGTHTVEMSRAAEKAVCGAVEERRRSTGATTSFFTGRHLESVHERYKWRRMTSLMKEVG